MFVNTVPCGETYQAITRPAILASIEQLLKFYHVNMEACQIYFNGDADVSKLFGTDLGLKRGADGNTDFKNRDKLYIVAEVNDSEFNNGYGNNYRQDTHMAFWHDKETNTSFRPMFKGKIVNVDVNRHFRTRQDAVDFKNAIERVRTQQIGAFTFDAKVHFPVNTTIVELIKTIYDYQVNAKVIDPVVVPFAKWLFSNAKRAFTIISNLSGKNKILVSPILIENTELILNEPNVSKVNKGDYLGRYEVSFSYTFYWQEFIGWQFSYPYMVCQQVIPAKFINGIVGQWSRPQTLTGFLERTQMMALTQGNEKYLHTPYYNRIPLEDPWAPPQENYMEPKLQVTLSLTNTANQILFNIGEIPNFKWNPFYLKYILRYRQYIFQKYNCPLTIKIFSNDIQIDYRNLSMDDKGNIILNRLPSIKNIHRAVVYINYDIGLWSEICVSNLLADRKETKTLIDYIMPWLKIPDDWDENWFDKVIGQPSVRPPIYQMVCGFQAFGEE